MEVHFEETCFYHEPKFTDASGGIRKSKREPVRLVSPAKRYMCVPPLQYVIFLKLPVGRPIKGS